MYQDRDPNNTKFVLDRINQTEKYLGSICLQFGKVCRKEARLRDCNDSLAQNMFEFADRERINTTLRQSLQQYASYLSAVEDYRNTLITRIENQILEPLAKYGEVLKIKRQAVQKAINARDKGAQRQRKLQQATSRNPGNRDAIVAMQVNAEYAQTESSRADNVVQDEIDKFEQMKLTDIKKYLTDFTLINLAFHARAMEMYTYAHQQLLNIDIARDLEEFRTAAPFHRLHPSQRSVSETALNNPKRTTGGALSGQHSGSMSVLPDHRRDEELGSRHSLPADTRPYRGGSFENDDYRKPQSARGGLHSSSPTHEHSSKHGTSTSATSKQKTVKPNIPELISSNSSDSDD
ncbi:unnamed protein product [Rotaria magnacalcarata]|uniref:Uncharacterized protein n=1 Tax=Rotaria magnacalcarata TaxID=392030 RepID=A0A816PWH3_9BILA|nr:unnamed protein product [Rotaria magnacalcarata]CAF2079889.1 unnamed protein product [Rotaria magnacalcarata]CAF3964834.1 unnamed protein product [Rotaria magnacalcarata]CAF4009817.1 unnamed protein product [Rotaria magnacalcarata]